MCNACITILDMKIDCNEVLEVIDLKKEAEVPEHALRVMSKLENPIKAVDQCSFLEAIAEQIPTNSNKLEPEVTPDSEDAVTVVHELPQSHTEPRADLSESEVNALAGAEVTATSASALPSNINLNSSEPEEAVNVDPHENKSTCERSSRTCSNMAEDDGDFCGPSSDHCIGEWETDNEDLTTVVFNPDHIMYRDHYCPNCVLTFTSSCIKMEGLTLDDDDKIFKFQWGIEDILHIKSHWYELVETALVTIHVLTKDTEDSENVECPSGSELKFTVIGTNWHGRREAITSLNVTYKALWSSMLELEDMVVSFTKYFPNFDQPFEEVVYPKGDVDAVCISKRDVDLLLPDTFVNDTIIDFYIKYLKNKIKPEERYRFHFFNSFFFRKLADPDKDKHDASEGRAAFQRVKKWTRKVNLFEKDYVFIPVNYNFHWSLIVMCHLGEVATYKDEDVNELIKVPCVLHMDSIRGSHTGLKGLIQSYLKEEWKGRQQEASEDISSRFDNLRFISLELPQQPNSFDCGLFLLHYVELFLEQVPINFNPFNITKSVNFLNVDWFPPADASLKRVVIQRLVYDLLEHPSHEAPSMAAKDEHRNLTSPVTNIHEVTAVNFFPEKCDPSTACQNSESDQGIEISLLPSLSIKSEVNEGLKPSFELTMHFPSFDEYKNPLMPSIKEASGRLAYSPTENEIQQGEFENEKSWLEKDNLEETSVSGCEDPLEVVQGTNGRSPLMELIENGSGESSSGLESNVHHHPTKKMRMTETDP